jgi:hypothetical protein
MAEGMVNQVSMAMTVMESLLDQPSRKARKAYRVPSCQERQWHKRLLVLHLNKQPLLDRTVPHPGPMDVESHRVNRKEVLDQQSTPTWVPTQLEILH